LTATFEIANKKAEKALYTSDVATTDNADGDEGKRVTKRPVVYTDSEHPTHKRKEKVVSVEVHNIPPIPNALMALSNVPPACEISQDVHVTLSQNLQASVGVGSDLDQQTYMVHQTPSQPPQASVGPDFSVNSPSSEVHETPRRPQTVGQMNPLPEHQMCNSQNRPQASVRQYLEKNTDTDSMY